MNTKTVYTQGAWSVVRTMSCGFSCNAESASWHVEFDGKFFCSLMRKKDAVKIIQTFAEKLAA